MCLPAPLFATRFTWSNLFLPSTSYSLFGTFAGDVNFQCHYQEQHNQHHPRSADLSLEQGFWYVSTSCLCHKHRKLLEGEKSGVIAALFVVRNKFWEALGSYCDACGLQYKPGSQKRSRDKESYDIQRSNKFCNWETHHFGPRWPIWTE